MRAGKRAPVVEGHPQRTRTGCHRPCTDRWLGSVPSADVEFGALGPLEVRTATGEVQVRRGLPRTLLLALLLRPGHALSSDLLMVVLWGDEQPRNPANALQIQVSYLRKLFANAEPTGAQVLETRPGGYVLVIDNDQVDVARFDAAARTFAADMPADTAGLNNALAAVDAALGLWRGDAFEEIADLDIARGEAARLNEARWAATEYRNELRLRLGHH